jgi:hypothetical protein
MIETLLVIAHILAANDRPSVSVPWEEFLLAQEKRRTSVTQLTPHAAGIVSGHLVWLGMHCRGHTTAFASEQFELVKDRGKEFQRGFAVGVQEANGSSAGAGIAAICDVMASRYGPDGTIPGLWKTD